MKLKFFWVPAWGDDGAHSHQSNVTAGEFFFCGHE